MPCNSVSKQQSTFLCMNTGVTEAQQIIPYWVMVINSIKKKKKRQWKKLKTPRTFPDMSKSIVVLVTLSPYQCHLKSFRIPQALEDR